MKQLKLLAILSIACGSSNSNPDASMDADTSDAAGDAFIDTSADTLNADADVDSAVPAPLSLLDPGPHLGMIVTFEALPDETAAVATADWDEALERGMTVGRIHHDWVDFEPTAGTYNRDELEDALLAMEADGLQSFVSAYVADTDDADSLLPADLAGRSLDDPEVLARYAAFLDWAVPMIVEHGGWVLAVGNEPDGHLLEHPEDTPALATFIRAAREHVNSIDPRLAVTITLTRDSLTAAHGPVLIAETDAVTFNYYPLDLERGTHIPITETSMAGVQSDVDAMLAAAGGRPVLIQELGCPAGADTDPFIEGASAARQAEFIDSFAAVMAERPQLRAAFWFQQVDWSESLTSSIYTDVFRMAGFPEQWVLGFAEWLQTSGFLRYEDGSTRELGWTAYLEAQDILRTER